MTYKRPESKYFQCRRKNLPGYGDTGAITSKSTSKRVAMRMERLLEDLAERALIEPQWRELLDAVVAREIDLPTLLLAHTQRRLPELLRSLSDPLLTEAVAEYLEQHDVTRQNERGFDVLVEMAPDNARLSYVTDAQNIMALCHAYEATGVKRNSVIRMLKRAISKLLRARFGNAERNRIFDDVHYKREDDTREVFLTPKELTRLVDSAEALGFHHLAVALRFALLTSADRGTLFRGERPDGFARGLLARDLRIYEEDGRYSGFATIVDGKAEARDRTVPFGDDLARELLVLVRDKEPNDPVFDVDYRAFDNQWQRTRKRAKLTHVRFKDLRAQTAIYAQRAGIPQAVTQHVMGHGDEAMTRRYQRHEAAMTGDQVSALESAMFKFTGT